MRGYSFISKPLTALLKKDSFAWKEQTQMSFEQLKSARTSTPTLALSNFYNEFILETDASFVGIGAVQMQEGHPIAYISLWPNAICVYLCMTRS